MYTKLFLFRFYKKYYDILDPTQLKQKCILLFLYYWYIVNVIHREYNFPFAQIITCCFFFTRNLNVFFF